MFDKRKFAGSHGRQRGLIEVIDIDRQAGLGKGEDERNTHVAGTAHDRDICCLRAGRARRRRFGRCDIQLGPLSPVRGNILANRHDLALLVPDGLLGQFPTT